MSIEENDMGKCQTVVFEILRIASGIHAFKQTYHVNQIRLVKAPNKFPSLIPSDLSPPRRLPLGIPIEKRVLCRGKLSKLKSQRNTEWKALNLASGGIRG